MKTEIENFQNIIVDRLNGWRECLRNPDCTIEDCNSLLIGENEEIAEEIFGMVAALWSKAEWQGETFLAEKLLKLHNDMLDGQWDYHYIIQECDTILYQMKEEIS